MALPGEVAGLDGSNLARLLRQKLFRIKPHDPSPSVAIAGSIAANPTRP